MTPLEQTYTVLEVAEALQVSEQTVLKLIKEQKIKSFKIGRNYRVKHSDMEKYLTHK